MLEEKAFLLPHIKNTVRGDMLRKSMHQLRYRRIREDIFFEEANPVSLQALKTMCNLCGLLLVCAAVLFLAESYVPFRRKFEDLFVSVRNVSFGFRRKWKRNITLHK